MIRHEVTYKLIKRDNDKVLIKDNDSIRLMNKSETTVVINNRVIPFVHDQIAALSTWTVTHNLGYKPSVTIIDSSGQVVLGDVDHTDLNELTCYFSAPFSGQAILI